MLVVVPYLSPFFFFAINKNNAYEALGTFLDGKLKNL
jgi:hypothetical protein